MKQMTVKEAKKFLRTTNIKDVDPMYRSIFKFLREICINGKKPSEIVDKRGNLK